MTTWQRPGAGLRLRGGETHHERTATRRSDLIVPRESNLPGEAKYRLLSRAPPNTRVRARTGSGDVRVAGVTGAVEAMTGSGRMELTAVGGDVDVRTGAGPIGIVGLDTALRARTGTGRIRVEGAPGGAWDLSTGSGGIRIDLPDDAAFEIDARTSSGDVRTQHPVVVRDEARRGRLQGTVRGGGPRVTLRTGSGGIAID